MKRGNIQGRTAMKPLIIWLTLGACLLLFGCQDSNKQANLQMSQIKPSTSYCNQVDAFYNEDFAFSCEEDLHLFQAKINGLTHQNELAKTRLDGLEIFEAIAKVTTVFDENDKRDSTVALLMD